MFPFATVLKKLFLNIFGVYSKTSFQLPFFTLLSFFPAHNLLSIDKINYSKDVLPIFKENCIKCHGPEKQKSGLRIDLRSSLIKGGDSGLAAIKPGNWDGSFLMDVLTHKDEDMAMPPKGGKLEETEINKIKQWVDSGAFWPGQMKNDLKDEISLWSFKKIVKPKIPLNVISEPDPNPVDAFIKSKLIDQGLEVNPPADPVSLIKRTYIIFTGLIPDSNTVQKFVTDYSVDRDIAFKSLVNSLLD